MLSIKSFDHQFIKISLRTTGHLILGIARIYSKKTGYLLVDLCEVFDRVKTTAADRIGFIPFIEAFPHDSREPSQYDPNVLPKGVHSLELDVDKDENVMEQRGRPEDIALIDDNFVSLADKHFFGNDDFGDWEALIGDSNQTPMQSLNLSRDHFQHPGGFNQTYTNFNDVGPVDVNMTPIQVDRQSLGVHDISIPHDITPIGDIAAAFPSNGIQTTAANATEAEVARETQIANESNQVFNISYPKGPDTIMDQPPLPPPIDPNLDQEIEDEQELDDDDVVGPLIPIRKKKRQRRKAIFDKVTALSNEEMRQNVADYSDTIQQIELAPPSLKMLRVKMEGSLNYLMNRTCAPISRHRNPLTQAI
ncbi:hypothetical protein WR25_00840 [Diploscapter pachys]|uniref:Rad21/Rec8-like protein N-terminal domain-containing protein n=1 Tax=Diploscapter pachys TaxID=2018661 RepID=A0A2A2JV72_9BILA|nr:hypothetical protein WR25_00840 [Diploscapter pachys]